MRPNSAAVRPPGRAVASRNALMLSLNPFAHSVTATLIVAGVLLAASRAASPPSQAISGAPNSRVCRDCLPLSALSP